MTGDPSQIAKHKSKSSEKVTFGDDIKVKTIGVGDIGKNCEIFTLM